MVKTYVKGSRFERDLIHFLNYKGFAVARVPSSGGFLSPMDVIAIKKGLVVAIECKAWNKLPKLDKKQLTHFREWVNKAQAIGFVAWKKPGGKWLFLRLEDAEANRYEEENWLPMENVLNALDFR
jgi:Holliday junction resolvase